MKKSDLLKQVKYLTKKVLEADDVVKALKDEILEKEEEIRRLNEKLKLAEEALVLKAEEKVIVEPCEEEVKEKIPVPEMKYEDFDFAKETVNEDIVDVEDYAVRAISRIITESVKIGCVLASNDNPDKKELLNLALGRTEVAKNEISSISKADLQYTEIITAIDKEEADVKEYYQSILAQL